MTRERDVQTVIAAIEATPEASELRARVAAVIRDRSRSDPDGVMQEVLRLVVGSTVVTPSVVRAWWCRDRRACSRFRFCTVNRAAPMPRG